MGLLDAIRSALGGSSDAEESADEDEEMTTADDRAAATESTDATDSTDSTASGDAEVTTREASQVSDSDAATPSADETASPTTAYADRDDESTAEGEAADAGETLSGEGSTDTSDSLTDEDEPGESELTAEDEPIESESLTADDESGFDHLTTKEVSDGPDMAEEATAFITEAEDSEEEGDDAGADRIENIPEDDPRAEFVAQAEDLVDFWGEYDLDYSLESLTNLDDLVGEQWDPERFADVEFGGDDYDSQVFTDTVTQLGSYFGEVLVRKQDATWQQETGVGWTITVPSGPESEAAGATVTVFQVAEDCLTGPSTFTGMHDALADRLNLDGRAGDGDTPVDLDRADIETVASDEEIDDAAQRLREGAEDLADRWPGYDLDFSIESLERLEDLLEAEVDRERFEGVELGDETDQESMLLTAHVVGVAGYLAEVLRRQSGAEWADQGRMVLVVEHGDSRTRIDPIEVAIASVRGTGSLTTAVPDL